MTTLDTSGNSGATTPQETGNRREIEVLPASACEIITSAQNVVGSVPSGLPEVASESGGHVFRVTSGAPLEQVTITLDTRQLTDQARVRKVNQAIRRARRP